MSGLATAMWNHIPDMLETAAEGDIALAPLTSAQVASIASTLYFAGYFSEYGAATKGQRLFAKKGCATCHESSELNPWPTDTMRLNAAGMTAAAWTHGPAMLAEMNQRGIDWPAFSEKEMEDLIAFLNGENERQVYSSTRTETSFDTPGSSMVTP